MKENLAINIMGLKPQIKSLRPLIYYFLCIFVFFVASHHPNNMYVMYDQNVLMYTDKGALFKGCNHVLIECDEMMIMGCWKGDP